MKALVGFSTVALIVLLAVLQFRTDWPKAHPDQIPVYLQWRRSCPAVNETTYHLPLIFARVYIATFYWLIVIGRVVDVAEQFEKRADQALLFKCEVIKTMVLVMPCTPKV